MANFTEVDEARKILGLSDAATLKEIKRAYRTLAHRHHPDKHSGAESNEDEIMKNISSSQTTVMVTNIASGKRM